MDANRLQRTIAGILTTQGNVSVQMLAKRLRVRPHSVRYQLDKLVDSKSLAKSILVNQRVFGFQVFNLLFNLPTSRAKKALEFLKGRNEVAWLCQNIGSRRYEATIVAENLEAISELLKDMGEETGTIPRDLAFASEGEVIHWGIRFLTEGYSKAPVAHFRASSQILSIDPLDRQVINHFRSQEGTTPLPGGSKLEASPSTVKYRLEKLRKAGAISDETYFIRAQMRIFQGQIVLQLKSDTRALHEHITSMCSSNPHVECLIGSMGNWSYKILIAAESLAELIKVEEDVLLSLGKVVLDHSLYIRDRILSIRAGL